MKIFPKAKISELVQQTADDELLLYNTTTGKTFCLNQTSKKIYELCSGTNEISEIAEKSGLPESLVKLALSDLSKQNLLTEPIEFQASRRDLLRNIALTSIALPIVTTLIAPTAARCRRRHLLRFPTTAAVRRLVLRLPTMRNAEAAG